MTANNNPAYHLVIDRSGYFHLTDSDTDTDTDILIITDADTAITQFIQKDTNKEKTNLPISILI